MSVVVSGRDPTFSGFGWVCSAGTNYVPEAFFRDRATLSSEGTAPSSTIRSAITLSRTEFVVASRKRCASGTLVNDGGWRFVYFLGIFFWETRKCAFVTKEP